MIQSANMYRNNSCKTVGFQVPLPVNDSGIILYLRLRDLHNKLPHPSEEESYPRNTFALSKKKEANLDTNNYALSEHFGNSCNGLK